jgi:hypothetical protein
MKNTLKSSLLFVAFGLLFVAAPSFGAEIRILPGSSVQINSGEQTTVVCEGSSQREFFCTCDGSFTRFGITRFDRLNGQLLRSYIGGYQSLAECESRLTTHPACI